MERSRVCHVVAVPYPGRGHVNPMMHLCREIAKRGANIVITIVVTDEWARLIDESSGPMPSSLRLATVPNVLPSEWVRGKDKVAFMEAVHTKYGALVEEVLDRLELPVSCIVADSVLSWAVDTASRRGLPLASVWTSTASMFSVLHHFHLICENGHSPAQLSEEKGEEMIDYIPGVSPTRLADLPRELVERDKEKVLQGRLRTVFKASKAQYLLCNSIHELEPEAFNVLKTTLPFPVYPVCLINTIPEKSSSSVIVPEYLRWLDSQPESSVLYISFGSYLSASEAEIKEIEAGVNASGVRYLWVARGDSELIEASNTNGLGFVVLWCDQLRVLCHSSVGGFWTHCGWNSVMEGVFAGVPMLTFPIVWDQIPNSKRIVDNWKIGYRVRKEDQSLSTRDEITRLVRRLMDLDNVEGVSMRKRAHELRVACGGAVVRGGSSDANFDDFLRDITRSSSLN